MRRIALINQKGGVGKTTTAVNLGACLAEAGRRVLLVDLDPQANLTLHLGLRLEPGGPTSYRVLLGECGVAAATLPTATKNLSIVPTDIDLSGAELELASALGRETLLRDALDTWCTDAGGGSEPVDYVILDCPPSLGLLSVNGLAAAEEVLLPVQTEFFALQGLTKLMDTVELVQRRLHPALRIGGIVPCLYDSRLRLAREVLGELRKYFPGKVFRQAIGTNVKLAEAPSFGQTILEYAAESAGARDYRALAQEVLAQETQDDAQVAEPGVTTEPEPTHGTLQPSAGPPPGASAMPSGPGTPEGAPEGGSVEVSREAAGEAPVAPPQAG